MGTLPQRWIPDFPDGRPMACLPGGGNAWPLGVSLRGIHGYRDIKWREAFSKLSLSWCGLAAKLIFDHVLWPSDRDDLDVLLQDYPNHVIEFTACDRAVGTIPGRNSIIWEVRIAGGTYEKW